MKTNELIDITNRKPIPGDIFSKLFQRVNPASKTDSLFLNPDLSSKRNHKNFQKKTLNFSEHKKNNSLGLKKQEGYSPRVASNSYITKASFHIMNPYSYKNVNQSAKAKKNSVYSNVSGTNDQKNDLQMKEIDKVTEKSLTENKHLELKKGLQSQKENIKMMQKLNEKYELLVLNRIKEIVELKKEIKINSSNGSKIHERKRSSFKLADPKILEKEIEKIKQETTKIQEDNAKKKVILKKMIGKVRPNS